MRQLEIVRRWVGIYDLWIALKYWVECLELQLTGCDIFVREVGTVLYGFVKERKDGIATFHGDEVRLFVVQNKQKQISIS